MGSSKNALLFGREIGRLRRMGFEF